ncbi:MAG: hypothetical protein HKN87_21155 [Saprospiraceae bacterium]|nr:hypothetical protein [Saprospiraceae bacterium]
MDYIEIKEICEANTEATEELIEEQVYYAVAKEDLERKLDKLLAKYKIIVRKFAKPSIAEFQMQYFAHRVFKKNGLINKHLKHAFFKDLDEIKRGFLEHWAKYPWKYTFSVITKQPADEFFEMRDVFSGEEFLVYSPGISKGLQEKSIELWYLLIAFNGSCWQTYGPIGELAGFQAGDIHYYTALLKPDHWPISEQDILANVEKNPVPYFMLLSGSNFPLVMHGDHQIVQMVAEFDCNGINGQALAKHFIVDQRDAVYQLSLKGWLEFPHYAVAYYDKKEALLRLSALTELGYQQLISHLNRYGFDLPDDPDFRVSVAMQKTGEDILKRDLLADPYQELFGEVVSDENSKAADKLNEVMAHLVPDINAGRVPDFAAVARKTGVNVKVVADLAKELIERMKGAK